jgi:hypothetical protein
MNRTQFFISLLFVVTACGQAPNTSMDGSVTITIDDTKCVRGQLEADGISSSTPKKFEVGNYVISSTYLQIRPTKEAGKKFSEVNSPLDAELKANLGLLQAVTLISNACNSARTLSLWKDEASMMRFVGSQAHLAAIGAIGEISRGGSLVTHWSDDGSGFNWATAATKVKAANGPFY